jgi:hypothetical protein
MTSREGGESEVWEMQRRTFFGCLATMVSREAMKERKGRWGREDSDSEDVFKHMSLAVNPDHAAVTVQYTPPLPARY